MYIVLAYFTFDKSNVIKIFMKRVPGVFVVLGGLFVALFGIFVDLLGHCQIYFFK